MGEITDLNKIQDTYGSQIHNNGGSPRNEDQEGNFLPSTTKAKESLDPK